MKKVAIIDEETKPNPTVIKRVDTIDEAVQWIDHQSKIDSDKVFRGGYGIDAPEEMLEN